MPKIIFDYLSVKTTIECDSEEKIKEIFQRFALEKGIDLKRLYFLYNANLIMEHEIKFSELINFQDRERNEMNILVYKTDESIEEEDNKKIRNLSVEVICPIFKESNLVNIKDYKINLNNCKYGHKINKILLKYYEKTQKIESKIICNKCKITNKKEVFKNEFYICNTCQMNLCPLCYFNHDKSHKIINYDEKNNTCYIHNEKYIKFCNKCNKYICSKCEETHKNHDIINYNDILPNNNVEEEIKEFKKNIDKINNEIKDIIDKLNDITKNINLYYNICDNIIKSDSDNKNIPLLKNKIEFLNYNKIIIKEIEEIINSNNINDKFNKLMIIYDKMNSQVNSVYNNFIISEININDSNKNKYIRIINSFEQAKRENEWNDDKDDNKFENEKEILENCLIKIDNKEIPFSYKYKFNKKGKHLIEYYFSKDLTKTNYLFYDCQYLTSINLSNINTKNVTNMSCMFNWCESLEIIDLSNINTENVTNMSCMFNGCKSLVNIDLSKLDTQNVTDMSCMFNWCKSLKIIDLRNINTEKVTDMKFMFNGCKSLENLDLSSFNTKNVINMKFMFNECKSLSNINLSNFETQNVIDMSYMFNWCNSIKNLDLSKFITKKVKNMSYMFNGCKSLTNIDLSNFDTQNAKKNIKYIFNGCKSLIKKKVFVKDNKLLSLLNK